VFLLKEASLIQQRKIGFENIYTESSYFDLTYLYSQLGYSAEAVATARVFLRMNWKFDLKALRTECLQNIFILGNILVVVFTFLIGRILGTLDWKEIYSNLGWTYLDLSWDLPAQIVLVVSVILILVRLKTLLFHAFTGFMWMLFKRLPSEVRKILNRYAAYTDRYVLADLEKKHGSRNAEVRAARIRLAKELTSIGEYNEAESLYNREIALSEEIEGTTKPNLLILHHLASLLHVQRRYKEALLLWQRALRIAEDTQLSDPEIQELRLSIEACNEAIAFTSIRQRIER